MSHHPDLHPSLVSLCLPVCECFHVEGMSSFSDHKTIPHPSVSALCLSHRLTGAGKHLHLPSTPNPSKTNSCGSVWVCACLWISQSDWRCCDWFSAACCQVAYADIILQGEAEQGCSSFTGFTVDWQDKWLTAVTTCLNGCLTNWFIIQLDQRLTGWFTDWPTYQLNNWIVKWLNKWLVWCEMSYVRHSWVHIRNIQCSNIEHAYLCSLSSILKIYLHQVSGTV